MKIAISSGKGGTGKTFIATNIAATLAQSGKEVTYLDCDVEEPNGHLFLKPEIEKEEQVKLLCPLSIDDEKCTKCGRCAEVCTYNAIAATKKKVLIFPALCHVCGACEIVCPVDAIITGEKKIGLLKHGKSRKAIDFHYALLETGEGGMSPRLIERTKSFSGSGVNIYDSPPGTSCSVVATLKDADLSILVTDPTPFGINDLKLAVLMCRKIGQEPVVLVNRAEYLDDELKKYCADAKLEIIGEIPDDRKVAEVYSEGKLVIDELPSYAKLFQELADKILTRAKKKVPVKWTETAKVAEEKIEKAPPPLINPPKADFKEMVVISGKGGTGKTSLTACFAALAKKTVVSDCDVDAADLFLLLDPQIKKRGLFSGGVIAEIDQNKCTQCGRCKEACRFSAIDLKDGKYYIDPVACEGCGVCELVCRDSAVKTRPAVNGEWYMSETRFGPMSHAKLGIAEENSGRLVTLVRNKAAILISESDRKQVLADGAPGTGCPVIASLTGVDYALIVTEPTVSGIHDLARILDVTAHFGIKSGVVVNKSDLNLKMTQKIEKLAKERKVDLLGNIPYDKNVTKAQMKKLSMVEYAQGPATESIKRIWSKLHAAVF